MHYDIILFEHSRESINHLKDLRIIAEMLKSAGMNVAVLNIYGDYKQWQFPNNILLDKPIYDEAPVRDKNNLIKEAIFRIRQHKYIQKILNVIRDKADIFYFGSYDYQISTLLLDFDKPFFVWGLRSFTFSLKTAKIIKNPFSILKIINKKKVIHNPYAYFFVSNETIFHEFEEKGMPHSKMVIRPERLANGKEKCNYKSLSEKFRFLTIGWIRDCKRVEITISAYKAISDDNNEFYIVGTSEDNYENKLLRQYSSCDNIIRIRQRLDDKSFNEQFDKAHFVCFADYSDQNATITNGTLVEALLHFRPIIAPNYEPFKSLIIRFGVGLLYQPTDPDSYKECLLRAMSLGTEYFKYAIMSYLKTINYEDASYQLNESIKNKIIQNNKISI